MKRAVVRLDRKEVIYVFGTAISDKGYLGINIMLGDWGVFWALFFVLAEAQART